MWRIIKETTYFCHNSLNLFPAKLSKDHEIHKHYCIFFQYTNINAILNKKKIESDV